MSSESPSPLAWACGISVLIHGLALPLFNFENGSFDNEKDEQIINITLEPTQELNNASQQPLDPLQKTKQTVPIVPNAEIPTGIVAPSLDELLELSDTPSQKAPSSKTEPISNIAPQHAISPSELKSHTRLHEPNQLNEFSRQEYLDPVATVPQQIAQITPPPPQPTKALPPDTLQKDRKQPKNANPIQQTPIIQSIPPELEKPLPRESINVEKQINDIQQNETAIPQTTAATKYAEILHNSLNKRLQRKYPRKAIQNCIEGTVRVQIRIDPSGEQLSYKIVNPDAAPKILKEAAEKLLNRRKYFASFGEDLPYQPMTFEVNLVYRLPQCVN